MNNENKTETPEKPPSGQTQKERADKMFWHREQEANASHAIWNIIISLQAVIVGICTVLMNFNTIDKTIIYKYEVTIVFICTILSAGFLIGINHFSRFINSRRAKYFEDRIERKYDNKKAERTVQDNWYYDNTKCYKWIRRIFEIFCYTSLIACLFFLNRAIWR